MRLENTFLDVTFLNIRHVGFPLPSPALDGSQVGKTRSFLTLFFIPYVFIEHLLCGQ